ncbi:hypothetical protein AB0G00_09990 [Nocardia salmonicida]|uniref:hypothetical protein n=1 Tax=Nocardia salmonicida TaxID=53431 RepID=UPI0033CAEE07
MSHPNPEPPEAADEFDRQANELAELLKMTPPGDHPIVSEHLATGVVVAIGNALFDIRQMVDVHQDMAPVAAHRVMEFVQQTAQATMSWVKEWAQ